MIPRLIPSFSMRELILCAISRNGQAVTIFESEFAKKFNFSYGLFFPYGRSALYALLKTLKWANQEVVIPAYTCSSVPHAITLSGNIVRFVDCQKDHFNVSAQALSEVISNSTKMVIPTPIFGYPLDREGYREVITKKSPQAFVLYDVAHGFGVEDDHGLQTDSADAAIFGFGIGKMFSTLYGGMLLLRDRNLYDNVKKYRDTNFLRPPVFSAINRLVYGIASWSAFREPCLTPLDWLEENTKLLYRFTEYYYGKQGVSLPHDYNFLPTPYQARLGLLQIKQYGNLIDQRRKISSLYENRLREENFFIFDSGHMPVYSHFPLRIRQREAVMTVLKKKGIQVGRLIDYACPDLPGYEDYRNKFPNAACFSRNIINLPNWPRMSIKKIDFIINALKQCREKNPSFL